MYAPTVVTVAAEELVCTMYEDNSEKRRWWVRMRRAFEVPDLVTDAHARKAILQGVMEGTHIQYVQDGLATVGAIFDDLLKLGSEGRLDYLLVPEPYRRHLEPPDAFEAENVISLESLIRTDRGFVHETEVQLLGVVQSILDQFVAHVETHPFEDSRGRYFDLKPS